MNVEDEEIVASDMVALIQYSQEYIVVTEYHIVRMTKKDINVTDLKGALVYPEILTISWDMTSAKKGGYKHFMDKEIHEQPSSLRRTIIPRTMFVVDPENKGIHYQMPDLGADSIPDELFQGINRVIITACGTAMHAGMVGRITMERRLRLPVTVASA